MANSFTELNGYGFWTWDESIQLWLALVYAEGIALPDIPPWLAGLMAHWQEWSFLRIGGAVAPNLDDFVKSEDERTLLWELADRALARVRALKLTGATQASLATFGVQFDPPFEDFASTPELLFRVGSAFCALLRGEFTARCEDTLFIS